MTFWSSASLPVLAVLTLAGACRAEETPMPSQMVPPTSTSKPGSAVLSTDEISGLWSLRADTGEGRCRIALNKLPVAGAYGVHIESCTIAAVGGGKSWRPVEDGFELLGERGQVLMRFRRVDANAFTAEGFHLTPAPMA